MKYYRAKNQIISNLAENRSNFVDSTGFSSARTLQKLPAGRRRYKTCVSSVCA